MSWKPTGCVDAAVARAAMLRTARDFFAARNVLEVETPILSAHATLDPNIASVTAQVSGRDLFLHTSPEYHMKRLLAAGFPDMFQICRVFRDGEAGAFHLPEFTLVEWYRLGYELKQIITESVEFIAALLPERMADGNTTSISYADAFQQAIELDPLHASVQSIIACVDADKDLIKAIGDDRDTWLDLTMMKCVATTFAADELTVVYHYPISQASLARECPQDQRCADRFEIYLGELELANGFVELTDANEQQRRFEVDRERRRKNNSPVHEIDTMLIDALKSGLPQCAGVAIGLDRLLMIRRNAEHIREVTTFEPGKLW